MALRIVALNDAEGVALNKAREAFGLALRSFAAELLRLMAGGGTDQQRLFVMRLHDLAGAIVDLQALPLADFKLLGKAARDALARSAPDATDRFEGGVDIMVRESLRMAAADADRNLSAHSRAHDRFFEGFTRVESVRSFNRWRATTTERAEIRAFAKERGMTFAEARRVRAVEIDAEMMRRIEAL